MHGEKIKTGHIFTYKISIYIRYMTTTTVQNRSFLKHQGVERGRYLIEIDFRMK
jgi:hypothetical protein